MASPIRVQLILCDSAAADPLTGKLHMLGAGWTACSTPTPPHAVAVIIKVPWDRTNESIPMHFQLLTEDGAPVTVDTPSGPVAVEVSGAVEAGRPAGMKAGGEIPLSFFATIPPLELAPGRYEWRVTTAGENVQQESFEVR